MNKRPLGETIFEDIKKRIISGEYQPGDRLPTERSLADYYKVSRIPVREALAMLSKEGLVKTKRGSGTFTTDKKPVITSTEKNSPYLKQDTILLESIQLRCLIEAEASRQAALHATEEDILFVQKQLFHSIDQIRKLKAGQEHQFFQADLDFHHSVAKASHNPFFDQCLFSIPHILSTHQYWSLKNTTPMDEVVSYHTSIFEAILTQNAERAYQAMYQHLSRVKSLLEKGTKPDL